MTVSVNSPADVVNLALARIGHTWRVGSLFDGSTPAKIALTVYGQTRDEMLREQDWGFAERSLSLALQKTAPVGGYVPPNAWSPATNPPLPWIFQYAYPADCLKLRALKTAPIVIPDFNPSPKVFVIANDNTLAPPAKVILCNVAGAVAVYTGRVTDPATWEPLFVEALAASLSRRLAVALASPDMMKVEAEDEQAETAVATIGQG